MTAESYYVEVSRKPNYYY